MDRPLQQAGAGRVRSGERCEEKELVGDTRVRTSFVVGGVAKR